MIKANPEGCFPKIHSSSYIDETAIVIGRVKIGKNVFVGPGAVIRADENGSETVIKDNCNIQDRVIIHSLENSKVIVQANTSLAHGCIVHGPCVIGKNCFIGFGSVVFNAKIGDGVIIKHNCCVENINIPSGALVASGSCIASKEAVLLLKKTESNDQSFAQKVVDVNCCLVTGYKACNK